MFELEGFPLLGTELDSQMSLTNILNGSALNDSMVASDNAESLVGFAGDDTMLAAGGDDWLHGNQGRDWLNGNQGSDTAYGGQDQDTIHGGQDSDMLSGNKSSDWLSGNQQPDTIHGGQDNDIIYGGQGDDLLFGDEGNDTLSGDQGSDTLTGGNGQDVFVLMPAPGGLNPSNSDVIVDFNPSQDQIQLENGLTFNDLNLSDTEDGVTIQVTETGEFLTVVQGINTEALQPEVFISFSNESSEPEQTPTSTSEPEPAPEPTPTSTSEPEPTPEPTPTLISGQIPTPAPEPTPDPTPTPTPEPVRTPTSQQTPEPTPEPEPVTPVEEVVPTPEPEPVTPVEEVVLEPETETLNVTDSPQTISDFVGDSDPIDRYQLEIDQLSRLNVKLDGLSADADLLVFQDLNNDGEIDDEEILGAPFESENTAETIDTFLEPGTYFIQVEQFEGDTNYTLEYSKETVAALPEDSAGNTTAEAQLLNMTETPQTVSGMVANFDPIDLYRFEIDQASRLDLKLDGLSADADLLLFQDLNNDGEFDDNELIDAPFETGDTAESLAAFLEAGTYFIQVEQYSGNTDYTLEFSGTAQDAPPEDSAGDTLANAQNLDLTTNPLTVNEFVGDFDPVDLYRLEISQPSSLNVTLSGLSADVDLQLIQDRSNNGVIDDEIDVIVGSYSEGTVNETLNLEQLAPGTYFLDVSQFSGNTNYQLNINVAALATPADNAGNTLSNARDLGNLREKQTFNDFAGRITDPDDFYKFTVDSTSNFELTLTGLNADADVFLIQDKNGNNQIDDDEILSNSLNAGSASESINLTGLAAGNYFVEVSSSVGDTDYELSLSASEATVEPEVTPEPTPEPVTAEPEVTPTPTPEPATVEPEVTPEPTPEPATAEPEVTPEPTPEPATVEPEVTPTPTPEPTPAPEPKTFNKDWGHGNVNAAKAVAVAVALKSNTSLSVTQAVAQTSAFADVADYVEDQSINLYGINQINAPEVWAQGYTGKGIIVAVLDDGVDYKHVDLDGNIWKNVDERPGDTKDNDGNNFKGDYNGYDFADNDSNPTGNAQNSHGTHVAGTIGAEKNGSGIVGVAHQATIMPVRVLGDKGGTSESIAAGIRYAVDNGAKVINMSLGGEATSAVEQAALEYAKSKGVVVVAASGNERTDKGATQPGYPALYAKDKLGIAVGAIDQNLKVADFSNPVGNFAAYPFVTAPGVAVSSTVPAGYSSGTIMGNATKGLFDSWPGTSMATPHVAGVAALMLQANPNLTPDQVAEIITQTATTTGLKPA